MITFHHITEAQHGAYIDRLGYLVCVDCGGAERDGADWTSAASVKPDPCDKCGRQLEECTPREIQGHYTVEHVACKIF